MEWRNMRWSEAGPRGGRQQAPRRTLQVRRMPGLAQAQDGRLAPGGRRRLFRWEGGFAYASHRFGPYRMGNCEVRCEYACGRFRLSVINAFHFRRDVQTPSQERRKSRLHMRTLELSHVWFAFGTDKSIDRWADSDIH